MYKRTLVFSAACISIFLFGIGLITLGAVLPGLKEKFHLDEISAGTLFSILPFGILVGSLLFGPISDRFGYKALLVFSLLFMFAGFEGIAYAASLGMLQVCVFLFGMGGGAINGATSALVADTSDKSKGADLSLLGVFFGLGALSMPFFTGILKQYVSFTGIVSGVGIITFLTSISLLFIRFPPPKHLQGFPLAKAVELLKDRVIILIALFLFFQSSYEGIINNWTTSYLVQHLAIPERQALYALSLYMTGMTVMRLLFGTVFRRVAPHKLLLASLGIILAACLVLKVSHSIVGAICGLILFGAGLGGGFPIMLGYVSNRYTALSGTAFSFVLVVALIGNMLINYLMGWIAHEYGIHHLINVALVELVCMFLLFVLIRKRLS